MTLWVVAIVLLTTTGEAKESVFYTAPDTGRPRLFLSEKKCEAALKEIRAEVARAVPSQLFEIDCLMGSEPDKAAPRSLSI